MYYECKSIFESSLEKLKSTGGIEQYIAHKQFMDEVRHSCRTKTKIREQNAIQKLNMPNPYAFEIKPITEMQRRIFY